MAPKIAEPMIGGRIIAARCKAPLTQLRMPQEPRAETGGRRLDIAELVRLIGAPALTTSVLLNPIAAHHVWSEHRGSVRGRTEPHNSAPLALRLNSQDVVELGRRYWVVRFGSKADVRGATAYAAVCVPTADSAQTKAKPRCATAAASQARLLKISCLR